MKPYYEDATVTVLHGDCLDVLRELPDNSVDSVCTDPPYGLEFMGKEWDKFGKDTGNGYREKPRMTDDHMGKGFKQLPNHFEAGRPFQRWCELWATECLRVLKPGGHMLAFGGSRTWHRLVCAIEDAGFEVRDSLAYLFGSGFPKSLNVTNALDRIVPADARCVCGPRSTQTVPSSRSGYLSSHGSDGGQPHPATGSDLGIPPSPADVPGRTRDDLRTDGQDVGQASTSPGAATGHPSTGRSAHPATHPATTDQPSASAQFDSRTSTSAAPVSEPHRTPLRTQHTPGSDDDSASFDWSRYKHMACPACGGIAIPQGLGTALKPAHEPICVARKPLSGTVAATVLAYGTGALNIDGCRIAGDVPSTIQGQSASAGTIYGADQRTLREFTPNTSGRWPANVVLDESQADALDQMSGELTSGSRQAGTYAGLGYMGSESADFPSIEASIGGASRYFYTAKAGTDERITHNGIAHATVKPLSLMRYLVRLVTPPGGTILEPFAGSGTTVEAAILEGFRCIAIEREADYLPLITQRIHRRRNPVAYLTEGGHDLGLFGDDGDAA